MSLLLIKLCRPMLRDILAVLAPVVHAVCIEELDRYTLQQKIYKNFILCEFWFIELTLRA